MAVLNHRLARDGVLHGAFTGLTRDQGPEGFDHPVVLVNTAKGPRAWHADTPEARRALFSAHPLRGQIVDIYTDSRKQPDIITSTPDVLHSADPAASAHNVPEGPDEQQYLSFENEAFHRGEMGSGAITPKAMEMARQSAAAGGMTQIYRDSDMAPQYRKRRPTQPQYVAPAAPRNDFSAGPAAAPASQPLGHTGHQIVRPGGTINLSTPAVDSEEARKWARYKAEMDRIDNALTPDYLLDAIDGIRRF